MIEIEGLAPVLPVHVAIALEQRTPRPVVEIIERLGDIHQRIAGKRPFKIQNARELHAGWRDRGEQIPGVQVIVAKHGLRTGVEELCAVRKIQGYLARERRIAAPCDEFIELPLELVCQVGVIGRMRRQYAGRADVTEGVHGDAVKLAEQLSDLHIGGDQLLRWQGLLQRTQTCAVHPVHDDEAEIKQLSGIVRPQDPGRRHAEPVLDQASDDHFLLHLPMQRVGIDFQDDRGVAADKADLVNRGNLAAVNVGDGRNRVPRNDPVNNRLGRPHGYLQIGSDTHGPDPSSPVSVATRPCVLATRQPPLPSGHGPVATAKLRPHRGAASNDYYRFPDPCL